MFVILFCHRVGFKGRNSSLVVMKPARTIVRPGFKSRRRHFFLVEEKTTPKILDVSFDPATSKMVNPFGYCGTDSPIRRVSREDVPSVYPDVDHPQNQKW